MLYSYKMIVDKGFAPNPFYGYLTLATCKPYIRRTKVEGDYIAGFTSANMMKKYEHGFEQLIYLMKVTEKMSYEKYYHDPRFKHKIPADHTARSRAGDNIYHLKERCYTQVKTKHHSTTAEMKIDLQCHQVLISNAFFYFGRHPEAIDQFNIKKPSVQSAYGVRTTDDKEIERLWSYLKRKYKMNKVLHLPHHFGQ